MVILLWHTRWSAGTWPPCPGWWSPPPCLKSSPMPACFFQGVGLLAGVCRYLEYFFASSWTLYVTLGFIKTHFLGRGSNASINFTFFSVYTSLAKRPCWFYLAIQIKPVDLPDQRHNEGSGHPPLPQGHTHHSMCWKILFHDSPAQRGGLGDLLQTQTWELWPKSLCWHGKSPNTNKGNSKRPNSILSPGTS